MPAPEGNQNNKKWKTPKERQAACKAFCDHIREGYSIASFPLCDHKTIRYYIEEYPVDFPPEEIEQAFREGRHEWEKIGKQGAKGELSGFNNGSWIFNMKNRYGWKDTREFEGHGLLPEHKPDQKPETIKPKSSAEIALGVVALLQEELADDGDASGEAD